MICSCWQTIIFKFYVPDTLFRSKLRTICLLSYVSGVFVKNTINITSNNNTQSAQFKLLYWSKCIIIWLQQNTPSHWLLVFSCNDHALFLVVTLLAGCPRHNIQSVFNLTVDILMDIHVMVNWQLSKRVCTDQCHLTVPRDQVYNSSRWRVFLKLSADQLLVLIDRRLGSIMKRPHNKYLFNLIHSVITGKSLTLDLMYWPSELRPRSEISL